VVSSEKAIMAKGNGDFLYHVHVWFAKRHKSEDRAPTARKVLLTLVGIARNQGRLKLYDYIASNDIHNRHYFWKLEHKMWAEIGRTPSAESA
jgi:hypothetical protein